MPVISKANHQRFLFWVSITVPLDAFNVGVRFPGQSVIFIIRNKDGLDKSHLSFGVGPQ
jgi:hypothetical protein